MAVRKMTLVSAMLVCCWACFLVLGALWVADRWVDAIKAEVSFGRLSISVIRPEEALEIPSDLGGDRGDEFLNAVDQRLRRREQVDLWVAEFRSYVRTEAGRFHFDSRSGLVQGLDSWIRVTELRVQIWFLLLVFSIWPVLAVCFGPVRRYRRRRRGRCVTCGYDLRGNVSGRCPECGTPVAHTA